MLNRALVLLCLPGALLVAGLIGAGCACAELLSATRDLWRRGEGWWSR